MDLRKLKYFRAVAELKSFSRASLHLRIAQPALSRQVKRLEEELEVVLFHRDGRGAHLTEAGAELYRHATRVEDRIRSATDALQKYKNTSLQEVAIGAPPSIGPHFLAEVAKSIKAYNPNITLRIIEGFSEQLADWLQTGRLDIALLYGARAKANIEIRMVILERLCLIAEPDHSLTKKSTVPFETLTSETIISPGLPSTTRDCMEKLADEKGIKLKYEMHVDSIPALKAMVSSQMGCTILPMAAAADEIERGELTYAEIINPSAELELVVGVSHLGKVSKEIYPICDIIHDYIATQIASGNWHATLQ